VAGHAAAELEPAVLVTVVAGLARVDVELPRRLPVAELLPALVSRLGVAPRVSADLRLVTAAGVALDPELGLLDQGVGSAEVLALVAAEPATGPAYDDPVEEITVTATFGPGAVTQALRRTTPLTVCLLGVPLAVAAWGSGAQRPLVSAVLALLLLLGAAVTSAGSATLGLVVGWSATGFAALAGAATLDHRPALGAGCAVVAVAAVGMLGLDARRAWLLPAAMVGAAAALVDTASLAVSVPLAAAVAGGLAVVALPAWPRVAGRLAGLPDAPPGDLASRVATARQLVAALVAGTGCVLAALAPLAVTAGAWGLAVSLVEAAALLLAVRRQATPAAAAAAGIGGVAVAAAALTACAITRPDWVPWLLPAPVVGVVALIVAGPGSPPARVTRMLELAEPLPCVALPPLVVLASGVVTWPW